MASKADGSGGDRGGTGHRVSGLRYGIRQQEVGAQRLADGGRLRGRKEMQPVSDSEHREPCLLR